MSKKFVWLISILLILSIPLSSSNVLAAPDSRVPARPHTPDLLPSRPHLRVVQPKSGQEDSLNWAGYAVSAGTGSVSDVKGSWKVPRLSSSSSSTSYAAFWVGIDGFSDNTVEQTGVLAEYYRGQTYYYTWYEFYPNAPVYTSLSVKAGDTVYAEVSYASGLFTVTLTDETTGATFTTSQSDSSAQRSSAEWITEAPSSGYQVLPLANFGTALYGYDNTNVASTGYATVNGVTNPIGSFGSAVWTLTMVTQRLTVKAAPSTLTSDRTSFTVAWKHS